jgi:signal transduction histidine kinase
MLFRDMPIQKKLMRVILLISGIMLLITSAAFFVYEFYAFRQTATQKLSTVAKVIATNSTAALAFDNHEDAYKILLGLKTEPHIVAASLYDKKGNLFSHYPANLAINNFPVSLGMGGFRFSLSHLEGFEPVVEGNRQLGTLYLKSDLEDMYERLRLYGIITISVIALSLILAYILSKILQKSISKPILALAETTKSISEKGDYSQRAIKSGEDELGLLTDRFNQMLEQIEKQNLVLNEFNQDLEHKISVRTSQLQTVNSELESFSYSISHDLRAPLRTILGFATMLEENFSGKLDDEARRITSVIKINSLKMGHLIDDLLSFSRIGRQELKKTRINTIEMVQQVIAESAVNNNEAGIDWAIESLPDSKGDPNAVRQVWINLVSNAVKYSRNNSQPRIEIGSFTDMDKDQQVFFIRDNGIGFNEKYKDKLFKVFQRLHSADEFEGTGVGLAIVEKVISKHGGTVWVEAAVNKGACFYFSLPV